MVLFLSDHVLVLWRIGQVSFNMIHILMLYIFKAIDTVRLKQLILKLQAYGVHSKLLSWLFSFLYDYFQHVCLNGSCSEWNPITSRVSQGSVLNFLSSILMIYALLFPAARLFKFADEVKLYRLISNLTYIQLLTIGYWFTLLMILGLVIEFQYAILMNTVT